MRFVLAAFVIVPLLSLTHLVAATLGFGILVQKLLYTRGWMFTSLAQGRRMPAPSFADTPKAFYYVVLAAVVVTGLAVAVIQRSRLGRLLQGMSGSPRAVTAMGL